MRDRLETERLILRPLELSDAGAFSTLASDYAISSMTGSFPHPFPQLATEFKIMQLRAARHNNKGYPYAITRRECDSLIGVINLHSMPDGQLELGYWIGHPFWGHGYATEAGQAFLAEVDRTLDIPYVDAGIFQDNPASGRVLEKLGFNYTGKEDSLFSMSRMAKAPGKLLRRPVRAA